MARHGRDAGRRVAGRLAAEAEAELAVVFAALAPTTADVRALREQSERDAEDLRQRATARGLEVQSPFCRPSP